VSNDARKRQIVRNKAIGHSVRLVRVGRVVRSGRAGLAARSGRPSRNVRALRAGVGEGFAGGRTQEVNNADELTFRPELGILLTAQQ
jgi:hypothetical protein